MDITTRKTPYGAAIAVCSRLDILTSKDLNDAVSAAIEGGANNLILDFSSVEYVSSSGLRVLLTARKMTKAKGGVAVLCCLSPFVKDVLATTGFDQLFTTFATLAEAEASFPS